MTRGARPETYLLLSEHLQAHRRGLLQQWRDAVLQDGKLTTGKALPRRQLNDHVPAALLAFERHLRRLAAEGGCDRPTDETIDAADAHGTHRWQQGYDLHEVVRELGHLNLLMVREMDAFAAQQALDAHGMAAARVAWATAYAAGIEQSTSQFFQLQQVEARGHVRDLEAALARVGDLEKLRAGLWEEMAHDLRGKVGVVALASQGLRTRSEDTPESRFADALGHSVESLRHLLDDVTNLARLQSGKEERHVAPFDASDVLAGLCDGLQGLARERRLYLRGAGPREPLRVEGDAVKVRRLAQNLVINALKYTVAGGVEVRWSAGTPEEPDAPRWSLVVRDTGPGISDGPGAPLATALKHATDVAHSLDGAAAGETRPVAPQLPPELLEATPDRPGPQAPGEGIGLSIVKRLAGLLDATLEVESTPGAGTAFTAIFPRSYPH
jgi:signal transduction histidine kinase